MAFVNIVRKRKDGKLFVDGASSRKEKRFFGRRSDLPVQAAYDEGSCYRLFGRKPRTNPYPPGRRHDEWNRGYSQAGMLDEHTERSA